jgi:uncharacterized paraquat-inducible protein A
LGHDVNKLLSQLWQYHVYAKVQPVCQLSESTLAAMRENLRDRIRLTQQTLTALASQLTDSPTKRRVCCQCEYQYTSPNPVCPNCGVVND